MGATRSISVGREVEAPVEAVWEVLADFPNIAAWNRGVKASHSTSGLASGIGATRHCDLAPLGALEETIQSWEPHRRMVVSIDEARLLPMRSATATFELEPAGEHGTHVSIVYRYEPQGPVGPMLDRQLKRGFTGFLDDLERAASTEGSAQASGA